MINSINADGTTVIRELTPEERDLLFPEVDTTPQTVPVDTFRAVCRHLGLIQRIETYLSTLDEEITATFWEWQVGEYHIDANIPDSMMQRARAGIGLSVEAFSQICNAAIAIKGMTVVEDIAVTIESIVTASLEPEEE